MDEILRRLARLEQIVKSMIRTGVVSSVNRDQGRVRVAFAGGFVSGWLPVLVKQSGANRDYWMPKVDEQVTCIFLPNGTEVGFVLGSFYSDKDAIPEGAASEGMRMTEFGDGARFEYDTDASKLRVLVGSLELEMTPDHVRFGGSTGTHPFVRGTDYKTLLETLIDLLIAHTHPTGVGPSGPPANAAALTTKKGEVAGTLSAIIKGR